MDTLKVLFWHCRRPADKGSELVSLERILAALRVHRVEGEGASDLTLDLVPYDLVCLYGAETRPLLRRFFSARRANKPIVVVPFYQRQSHDLSPAEGDGAAFAALQRRAEAAALTLVLRAARRVLAQTAVEAASIRADFGTPTERVVVLPSDAAQKADEWARTAQAYDETFRAALAEPDPPLERRALEDLAAALGEGILLQDLHLLDTQVFLAAHADWARELERQVQASDRVRWRLGLLRGRR